MFRLLIPHFRVQSVLELTVEWLRKREIDSLLLDVDCTLKRYRDTDVQADVAAWLNTIKTSGIGCCIVSNGRDRRIKHFADKLGLPFVSKAIKPLPIGIHRAIRTMEFRPDRTAIVGDQVFTDVLAGRLAGIKCILVSPIHPEEEPWFTRIKRSPERIWLKCLSGKRKKENDEY
jgi:uncharacterized protein